MRWPNQEGAFPFPVKYGYCATGVVEEGPAELVGRTVFCLHPHQDFFNVPIASPGAGAGRRAGAAGDADRQHGDGAQRAVGQRRRAGRPHRGGGRRRGGAAGRIAGGAAAGRRGDGRGCGREPRGRLWKPSARRFARPEQAPGDADIVFHASATAAGLDTAINCAGLRGHHRRDELVRRQAGAGRPRRGLPQPPPEARLLAGRAGLAEPPRRAGTIAAASRPPCACSPHARARCAGGRGDRLRGRAARAAAHPWRRARTGLAPVIRYPQA